MLRLPIYVSLIAIFLCVSDPSSAATRRFFLISAFGGGCAVTFNGFNPQSWSGWADRDTIDLVPENSELPAKVFGLELTGRSIREYLLASQLVDQTVMAYGQSVAGERRAEYIRREIQALSWDTIQERVKSHDPGSGKPLVVSIPLVIPLTQGDFLYVAPEYQVAVERVDGALSVTGIRPTARSLPIERVTIPPGGVWVRGRQMIELPPNVAEP